MFVDLNADIGERYGVYPYGSDEALLPLITSANIACGIHAGDPGVMRETVERAESLGVRIGAHPSYPDHQGFGRRVMAMSAREVADLVQYQMGALAAFTAQHRLHHVKPHGALYNVASVEREVAQGVVDAIVRFDPRVRLYAPFQSQLARVATEAGLQVMYEVFADRRYEEDGTLTPRSQQDAMIHDEQEACRQVLQIVQQRVVRARTGAMVPIQADTVCLHGDGPNPVAFASKLRVALTDANIHIGFHSG